MNSFFALTCLVTLAFASPAVNYCDLNCEDSGATHVACNRTAKLGSRCPKGTEVYDFTDMPSLSKLIVDSHNAKRSKVASGDHDECPKATRMFSMQWDPELALAAYYSVKECSEADICHRTHRYNNPGQNIDTLPMQPNSKVDDLIEETITYWFNSYKSSMDLAADIKSFPQEDQYIHEHSIAAFGRIVIDKNVAIGCAAVELDYLPMKKWRMICNYGYDTELGKPLYATGSVVGSGCTKKNTYYKNLCSKADSDKYIKTLSA